MEQSTRTSESSLLPVYSRWVWLLLAMALALGLFFRVYELADLPATVYVDEGMNGIEAVRILTDSSYRPVYSGEAQEPAFFFYLIAAVFKVAGVGLLQMKVVTVAASTATILALFLLVRRMWGSTEAVMAAFFLAFSHWHFGIGRTAFIGSLSPLFDVLTYYFLYKGFQNRSVAGFVAAGVTLGLGLNTYYTSRMAPVVAVVLVLLLLREAPGKGQLVRLSTPAVFSSFLVCLPLILFALGNPGLFFQRFTQINSVGVGTDIASNLWQNVVAYALMFNFRGDPNGRHNVPGEPMLDLITGVFFIAGLIYLIFTVRRSRSVFVMLWLGLSLLPGIFSQEAPHALRTLPVAVIASLIAALGLKAVTCFMPMRSLRGGFLALAIVVAAYLNFDVYFGKGASQTWAWFEPGENLVGQFVAEESRKGNTVYLGEPYAERQNVDFMAWPARYKPAKGAYYSTPEFDPNWSRVVVPTSSIPEGLVPIIVPDSLEVTLRKGTLLPNLQPGFLVLDYRQESDSANQLRKANFGDKLSLLTYDLAENEGVVRFSPRWQVDAGMSEELRLSLRLVDGDGLEWGRVDGQLLDDYPTYLWSKGLMVENSHELVPETGTPPGEYRVQLVVYRLPDLLQLPIRDGKGVAVGTSLELGTIRLDKLSSLNSRSSSQESLVQFGNELEILAKSVTGSVVKPGESLQLNLLWRAGAKAPADLTAVVQFTGASGLAYSQEMEPGQSRYPISSWAKGDSVLQKARFLVPADLPSGKYTVSLLVKRRGEDASLPAKGKEVLPFPANSVRLGEVEVKGRERQYDLPSVAEKFDITLGGLAGLKGYSVFGPADAKQRLADFSAAKGWTMRIALYWQARQRFFQNYAVFVHLVDPSGRVVAQHDGLPAGGEAPTSGWLEGEIIEDVHEIVISPVLAPGTYRVMVGMYDSGTGKRLASTSGEDSVFLGTVKVDPGGGGGK